jgi:hypothetical protein
VLRVGAGARRLDRAAGPWFIVAALRSDRAAAHIVVGLPSSGRAAMWRFAAQL